jgi:predicted nucleic acid-binding protein
MRVVDSSGWVEYFLDSDRAGLFAPAIEQPDQLLVPVLSIYEVFKRLLRDAGEEKAQAAASTMQDGYVVDVDLLTCLEAAYQPLPLADSIIYTATLRHDAILWTQDAHFEGLPSVR